MKCTPKIVNIALFLHKIKFRLQKTHELFVQFIKKDKTKKINNFFTQFEDLDNQ